MFQLLTIKTKKFNNFGPFMTTGARSKATVFVNYHIQFVNVKIFFINNGQLKRNALIFPELCYYFCKT